MPRKKGSKKSAAAEVPFTRDYPPAFYSDEEKRIWELIHRRRRQVLIHSVLYYRLDKSIISDHQFDAWARELAKLQREYPEISDAVPYHKDAFKNFDGTTGYDLPIWDGEAIRKAEQVYAYHKKISLETETSCQY